MPRGHEGESDLFMQPIHDSPHQVPYQVIVLILANTVVCMKVSDTFAESMKAEKGIEHRYHG
jgi:hypothetical protein